MGADGKEGAYPDPTLEGKWELLFSVNNPGNIHTYEIEHFVGKSHTKQVHQRVHWKVGLFFGEISLSPIEEIELTANSP